MKVEEGKKQEFAELDQKYLGRTSAPGGGGEASDLLEGAAERRLGSVAYLPADCGDFCRAIGQQPRGNLDPPVGQVLHRRMADQARESLGESRAGQSGFGRERFQSPGVCRRYVATQAPGRHPDNANPRASRSDLAGSASR